MVRLEWQSKTAETDREPAPLGAKVEEQLDETVLEGERDWELGQADTKNWFYWMPSPGVRYYCYQEPPPR